VLCKFPTEYHCNNLNSLVCYQREGSFFVVAFSITILKISADGQISVYVGQLRGYQDGPATEAKFQDIRDLAIDQRDGTLYVAAGTTVRRISPTGSHVSTIAGGPNGEVGILRSLTFDEANNLLFVADEGNNIIRKIDLQDGKLVTVAGTGEAGHADGPAMQATLEFGVCDCIRIHPYNKGIYFTQRHSYGKVRMLSAEGHVSTIVPSHLRNPPKQIDGPLAQAQFIFLKNMFARGRSVYVCDIDSVRKIII